MTMENPTPAHLPRIFISHAWEDKPLVRRLEAELRGAGAEVWVDHEGIRGGDNLPERISEALEWCNTLVLVWSNTARQSRWVKLEWTSAVSLDKVIIPCRLDGAALPAILAHRAYLDFRDVGQGIIHLLHALKLARQVSPQPNSDARTSEVARIIHSRFAEPSLTPQESIKPIATILLRAQPVDNLSAEQVKEMLREKDFFDSDYNKTGKGLQHEYELKQQNGSKMVLDNLTGLVWQSSGSLKYMHFADAQKYADELNSNLLAGCNDWSLPTLEEAMSLMERKKYGDLYLDSIFDRMQRWIWTADQTGASSTWLVNFTSGGCDHGGVLGAVYARAVRRGQSTI